MFRRELYIVGAIVMGIFLAVAGSSWYIARALQKRAIMVVLDTLPGLVDAGEAISLIHENWLRIHLLAQSADPPRRAALISQILTNSTEGFWQDYRHSMYSQEDKQTFQALVAARSAFLERRDRFLELEAGGRKAEAATILAKELPPLYARYEGSARALFAYNARVGRETGVSVLNYARFAPLAISAMATFLFLLGMLFGWRFAWSGPDLLYWLQRKRVARSPFEPAFARKLE